jgi:hypothetical protein
MRGLVTVIIICNECSSPRRLVWLLLIDNITNPGFYLALTCARCFSQLNLIDDDANTDFLNMSDLTMAAQLKNEGNELFRKQDYGGALAKYSEALSLDDKNAVLYANRAACNYGLNK